MNEFIGGQRWISDAEPELGLGLVLTADGRRVTLLFPGSGETRQYARATAPLRRVLFQPGDTIRSHTGESLRVTGLEERAGLIEYRCGATVLPETELSNFLSFSRPQERLFAGQIDRSATFQLRLATLRRQAAARQSDLRGLIGARMALLPHQLYIAHEVAHRYAPRVLLADEVGLGKTIEAGLILHQLLVTGRVQRVLILVPEPLLHQWFVELLRRFNLPFSLYDEERCQAISADNPFLDAQWVLCSTPFLSSNPQRQQQALAAGWDLLIVDEAHHLSWSPGAPSPAYALVETLAARTPGLLLLTATPEQLGQAGHFARLRLLDPDRFHDLAAFLAEADDYRAVARLAADLLSQRPLDDNDLTELRRCLGEAESLAVLAQLDHADPAAAAARQQLIEDLLDRHGTGRVLFRNTRAAVPGFPHRCPHPYPLPCPAQYPQAAGTLWPERAYQARNHEAPAWWRFDPRVDWLVERLRQPEKILLICAHKETVLDLEDALRVRSGAAAALFHEDMPLVARDRAAAWFADSDGARILLCSEIGSEGRNFQFAQHLVLFDLPFDPALLEQRIGRLDRIGQRGNVQIHIPYLTGTAQETLYRWYHQGLNAFAEHARAADAVFAKLEQRVRAAVLTGEAIEPLLAETRALNTELAAALEQGRDRLLELHSHRPAVSQHLVERIAAVDADPALEQYMEELFDHFGVHSEEHSLHTLILQPDERMQTTLPGLPDDGLTVTYGRERALGREDMALLSWDHPLVRGTMEFLLGLPDGNAAVARWQDDVPGTPELLLEVVFVLECIAPGVLQADRFLPPTPLRIVIDPERHERSGDFSHEDLNAGTLDAAAEAARMLTPRRQTLLRELLEYAEDMATLHADTLITAGIRRMRDALSPEVERLLALRAVNPTVRDDEIRFARERITALESHMGAAQVRLDALRVVIGRG